MAKEQQMPKRKSVTDGMSSDAEKLMSGVQRKLIQVLDADTQSDELREHWPDHLGGAGGTDQAAPGH